MAIHYVAPLSKRVRFSLPCDHIDHNSTTYCWCRPLFDNRTQLHPTFLANLQQHAICNPTPLTTTLREGVLNGTIPSAVSNIGATLHALLPLAPLIPTGIPSKVVFHLPNGTTAAASTVGTLNDGYIRKVPLPRAPRIQHASQSPVETAQNVPVHFGSKVRHV